MVIHLLKEKHKEPAAPGRLEKTQNYFEEQTIFTRSGVWQLLLLFDYYKEKPRARRARPAGENAEWVEKHTVVTRSGLWHVYLLLFILKGKHIGPAAPGRPEKTLNEQKNKQFSLVLVFHHLNILLFKRKTQRARRARPAGENSELIEKTYSFHSFWLLTIFILFFRKKGPPRPAGRRKCRMSWTTNYFHSFWLLFLLKIRYFKDWHRGPAAPGRPE